MSQQSRAVFIAIVLVCSILGAAVPVGAQNGTDGSAQCTFPFTEADATGTDVTIEERPERIVVLGPSAAQTVWELDAQDRVVGAPIAPYTSYLQGVDEKANVLNADNYTVNQEAVVELEADLVLAPNIVPDDTVESLRDADQTVFKFGFGTSLEFVAEKTERTGQLIGSCSEAEAVNDRYWDRIEAVEGDANERDAPRVLYYTDGFGAGSGTFIDEIITTAGGVNVAAENGVEGYGELNDEAIVEWDPEVIVVSDSGPGVPESDAFDSTFAVENDQIVVVDGNYISQPGPRIVLALEDVAAGLAEAETAESNDENPQTDSAESSERPEPTDSAEGPTEETAEETPGFGIVIALVALASAALLARRR